MTKWTTCAAMKKSDGTACRCKCLPGSRYCLFHDDRPEIIAARKRGRRQGAATHNNPLPLRVLKFPGIDGQNNEGLSGPRLETAKQVGEYLSFLVGKCITGGVDHRLVQTCANCCCYILKSIEAGAFEERLAVVESKVRTPA
jgi:hypothetical protein